MKKQYYLKIFQSEIERFSKGQHNERLIYESIKSYSANGRDEVELSLRDIASRSSISYSTVCRFLPKVIKMGIVQCTGAVTRIGGKVNTYKVLLPETETVSNIQKIVASSKESVSSLTSSQSQINKVNKIEKFSNNITLNQSSFSEAMPLNTAREVFAVLGGKR